MFTEVCMEFSFKASSTDTVLFGRKDMIFTFNYETEKVEPFYTYNEPLER
jgi:hypothetical protein